MMKVEMFENAGYTAEEIDQRCEEVDRVNAEVRNMNFVCPISMNMLGQSADLFLKQTLCK